MECCKFGVDKPSGFRVVAVCYFEWCKVEFCKAQWFLSSCSSVTSSGVKLNLVKPCGLE